MLYFCAPAEPGPWFTRADSNGNAAGSSLEDAVLQGDAGARRARRRGAVVVQPHAVPGIDLDACGDPWIDELRAAYAGLGREVWVLDITRTSTFPPWRRSPARIGAVR